MVGESRSLTPSEYYSLTTRDLKHSESFSKDDGHICFGTEGSEVQILSPRPIPQNSSKNLTIQSAGSLGFCTRIGCHEPSARCFKHEPSPELLENSDVCRPAID